IAMHTYADQTAHLPPAAIHTKDGKALLSWRVALLPYLEGDALYREFKLDQPWDSEHNKKLIAKMPTVYGSPGARAKEGHTFYQVFTGKDTVFDGADGIQFADIPDGTSNTLLVLEGGKAVSW